MALHQFTTFSKPNRQLIFLLTGSHLLWCGAIITLWLIGSQIEFALPLWSVAYTALQLFLAAQLLLLVFRLQPEKRSRGFYLFWAIILSAGIWLSNQFPPHPFLSALKSGLLLLVATLIGAVLARYVRRLWEIIPICLAMSCADFASWSYGPTARFSEQIQEYYLAPEGPPPLIDMLLIKLAFPGQINLAPVFGVSDWIMVAFFATVAHRYSIGDNLLAPLGRNKKPRIGFGHYLPVSVVALFGAIILAQLTGAFIPALPLIALIALLWYFTKQVFFNNQAERATK